MPYKCMSALDIIGMDFIGVHPVLGIEFAGNLVQDYLFALIAFIILTAVFKAVKYFLIPFLKNLAERTKNDIDDIAIKMIDGVNWPAYVMVAFYLSLELLAVPGIVSDLVYYALVIIASYYAVKVLYMLVDLSVGKVIKGRIKEGNIGIVRLFKKIFKGIIIVAAFLFILYSFGIDITGAAVGVGVTGIVIGFALQSVLSDIFASFSIYFDKPFREGDFIVVGDDLGVVKKIGIKTTRIQSLQGQELIISNRELTETRINNYRRMERRRVPFNIGLVYGTKPEKLRKIPEMIKEIIENIDSATFERVHFKQFGDFSLNYEIVYYVESADYNQYMDIQQEINLKIIEAFNKEGIEMAFPSQTIYLSK